MANPDDYKAEYEQKTTEQLRESWRILNGQKEDQNGIPQARMQAIDSILYERAQSTHEESEAVENKRQGVLLSYDPNDFDSYVAFKYLAKKKNATQRGIEFSLTLSDMRNLLRRKCCYYTGVKLTDHAESCVADKRTIERLDSDKGYTKENTVACSYAANMLKNTLFEDNRYPQLRMSALELKNFSLRISEMKA